MSTYYKGYKVRLNPTKEQEKLLFRFAGASRYVWNYFLDYQKLYYSLTGKYKSFGEISKLFTELRNNPEYCWLQKISFVTGQKSLKDLDRAIWKSIGPNKVKGRNFPKFKSRRDKKQHFHPGESTLFLIQNNCFYCVKIGYIKLKEFNRVPVEDKYYNPRISFDGINWYLSIQVERETQALKKKKTEALGIDVGINNLITLSNGQMYQYDKKLLSRTKFITRRIRRLQSIVDKIKYRMEKVIGTTDEQYKSKNLKHLEMLLRKAYRRESRIRHDFIHKLTTEIIRKNPSKIVVEDLDVMRMRQKRGKGKNRFNRRLNFSLIGEILRQLEYKAIWNEIPLIKADRYYPSSKLCSSCGCKSLVLTPLDKTFCCPVCNYTEHRDINAAHNLVVYDPSLRGNP